MSIKIANKPYYVTCSQSYTLGKNQPYQVNKFIDGRKSTKIVEKFKSKKEADKYREKFNDKWIVTFCTTDGEELEDIEIFSTKQDAEKFFGDNILSNKEHIKNEEDEEDDRLIHMLETSLMDGYLPSTILGDDASDEERERLQRLQEAELADGEYDENTTMALARANDLLRSVAELYLDKNTIEKHKFILNKLAFEQQSISSITLQIVISNRLLKKIYKEIVKNPSPKNIDSLVKLQKMILDLSKYQREYIDSVQSSFKNLKKDSEEEIFAQDEVMDVDVVDVTHEDGSLSTNSRAELIKKLAEFRSASSDMKIPKSPNTKLVTDDPLVETEAKIYVPNSDPSDGVDSLTEAEDDGLSSSLNY